MSNSNNILKGNFQTKKEVHAPEAKENPNQTITEKLKTQALASLGGSMVYMERKKLSWDGEE